MIGLDMSRPLARFLEGGLADATIPICFCVTLPVERAAIVQLWAMTDRELKDIGLIG